MPFVTTNIAKNGGPEDWRWREAATFAFGSIMEGPTEGQLVPMVQQAMPFLMQARGAARRGGAPGRTTACTVWGRAGAAQARPLRRPHQHPNPQPLPRAPTPPPARP